MGALRSSQFREGQDLTEAYQTTSTPQQLGSDERPIKWNECTFHLILSKLAYEF